MNNEKEIKEKMKKIKEELDEIITPGAYFYDTERAQQLQDEYEKLEKLLTPEKIEKMI